MSQLDAVFARLEAAGEIIEGYSQEQIDRVARSVVDAGVRENRRLSELAVSETGYGRVADKMVKNELSTTILWDSIKDEKTVGIIREDAGRNIWEVAAPVGIVAAVIPCTNPTSTTLYKAIIALKGRNPILFSP
ncbi:MAG: acetaldehyde dehydrogenase, partial [Acidobacteria bacterium]